MSQLKSNNVSFIAMIAIGYVWTQLPSSVLRAIINIPLLNTNTYLLCALWVSMRVFKFYKFYLILQDQREYSNFLTLLIRKFIEISLYPGEYWH